MSKIDLLKQMVGRGLINFFNTSDPGIAVMMFKTKDTVKLYPIKVNIAQISIPKLDGTDDGDKMDYELIDNLNTMPITKSFIDAHFGSSRRGSVKPGLIYLIDDKSKIDEQLKHLTIKEFIPGDGFVCNTDYKDVLSKMGMSVDTLAKVKSAPALDFSYQFEPTNPRAEINKDIFAKQKAFLKSIGATVESLPREARKLLKQLKTGAIKGVLLTGVSGTGKSVCCTVWATDMGSVLIETAGNRGTQTEDLVGSFQPKTGANIKVKDKITALREEYKSKMADLLEKIKTDSIMRGKSEEELEKTKVEHAEIAANLLTKLEKDIQTAIENSKDEGNWEFIPGPLLIAYYLGYMFKIDEVNTIDPAVLALVNSFTDGTLQICVCGQYYHKHPNFIFTATCNPGYTGTLELNLSFINRMAV